MTLSSRTQVRLGLALVPLLLSLTLVSGCSRSGKSNTSVAENESESQTPNSDANQTENASKAPTLMDKARELYETAKASGNTSASNAKEWMQDMYQKSVEKGKTTAGDVQEWVNDMYRRAKDSGTTTAQSARDWVNEDLSKIGTWEYASRTVASEENPDEVVSMLNQMGRERWECFWVERTGNETTLYFKKPPKSYMGKIPLRDLARFLPLMIPAGSGDAGQ